MVAAFISNCAARNNRLQVLKDLSKLLPGGVHSFGACEHNKDPEVHVSGLYEQKEAIAATYKFMYVPENSNDVSYVTEKVYDALKAGSIPIYMGAPDIKRFVPVPEAVISVADFNSTTALAKYIQDVGANESLWTRHMDWKSVAYDQLSQEWHELVRIQERSYTCRMAMHMMGLKHTWRRSDVKDV